MKDDFPRQMVCRTPAYQRVVEIRVHAEQWNQLVGNQDRWPAWVRSLRAFQDEFEARGLSLDDAVDFLHEPAIVKARIDASPLLESDNIQIVSQGY